MANETRGLQVLLNEKTMTTEGVETTFASHLAFGCRLLTRELLPLLRATPGSRVVFTSSGGMRAGGVAGFFGGDGSGRRRDDGATAPRRRRDGAATALRRRRDDAAM